MSAWIEITDLGSPTISKVVALPVSAWIEIEIVKKALKKDFGRTPRECVD